MRRLSLSLALVAGLIGCGGSLPTDPTPDPTPQATPTPPPQVNFHPPLRATSNGFQDASGRAVALHGASYFPPDSKAYGWPSRVSREKLEQISKAGMNFVAVRLGPFIERAEGSDQVGYKLYPGGKVDLDSWNDSFWGDMESFLRDANSLGIYVELDMIDAWGLERRLNPWAGENNINGVDEGDCGILSGSITYRQQQWVNKVGELVAKYPNTLLQISNESGGGNCHGALKPEWELSVYRAIKSNLSWRGVDRPVGTNSEDPTVEHNVDYVEHHSCSGFGSSSRPSGVNEWNCALPIAEFCARQKEAVARGGWFLLWGDNMAVSDWEEALKCPM